MEAEAQLPEKQFFDKRATQLQLVSASRAFRKLGHCSPFATHRICRGAGSLDSAPGLNKGKILVFAWALLTLRKTHLVKE